MRYNIYILVVYSFFCHQIHIICFSLIASHTNYSFISDKLLSRIEETRSCVRLIEDLTKISVPRITSASISCVNPLDHVDSGSISSTSGTSLSQSIVLEENGEPDSEQVLEGHNWDGQDIEVYNIAADVQYTNNSKYVVVIPNSICPEFWKTCLIANLEIT